MIFKQYGKLVSGFASISASATPTTLITPGSDEWIDVYNIVVSSNDTVQQQLAIDDGAGGSVIGFYFVGGTIPTVFDAATVPVRTRKGSQGGVVRATIQTALTGGKVVTVKITGLISKT